LKAIAKLHTLEYDIKILNALLSTARNQLPKRIFNSCDNSRSVTTTHSTIAADKNKNSGKYSEEISDLEKIVALEKQEDLNRSNTNYDQLIQILNSKKHPMTL
jgi:hypothetical protein